MENEGGFSSKVKNLLKASILAGSLITGKGEAKNLDNQSSDVGQTPEYSQTDEVQTRTTVPSLTKSVEHKEENQLSFSNLGHGLTSSFDTKENIVIKDETQWEEYWKRINSDPNVPVPSIDFEKELVILSTQGHFEDNRHAISITGVVNEGSNVKVKVVSTTPAPNCPIEKVEQYPFHAVKTERIKGPDGSDVEVNFEEVVDEGCYDLAVISSAISDGKTETYNPPEVVITPFTP